MLLFQMLTIASRTRLHNSPNGGEQMQSKHSPDCLVKTLLAAAVIYAFSICWAHAETVDTFDYEKFFNTTHAASETRALTDCYLAGFDQAYKILEALNESNDDQSTALYFLIMAKIGGYSGVGMNILKACEKDITRAQLMPAQRDVEAITVTFMMLMVKADREVWNRCLDYEEYNPSADVPCNLLTSSNNKHRRVDPNNPWKGRHLSNKPLPNQLMAAYQNSTSSVVHLKFFSQDRNYYWPDVDKFWILSKDSQQSYSLNCNPGEKICWGAAARNVSGKGYSRYWGVGLTGRTGCKDCCFHCGSRVGPVVFSPQKTNDTPAIAKQPEGNLEHLLASAMTLNDTRDGRKLDSGVAIRALIKNGYVRRKPASRQDYSDYRALQKPFSFMGAKLLVVEEQYMAKYVGCCVNPGIGILLDNFGNSAAIAKLATTQACTYSEDVYDVENMLSAAGLGRRSGRLVYVFCGSANLQ